MTGNFGYLFLHLDKVKAKTQAPPADYRKLSDRELVHRYVQRSDHAAVHVLFERYGHLVWGVFLKQQKSADRAKDTTQKFFIQLLDELHKFETSDFKGWVFTAVQNYSNATAAGKRTTGKMAADKFNGIWEEDRALNASDEDAKLLDRFLSELSSHEQRCIDLFYNHKLNYAAISRKTGLGIPAVKMHLQQSRQKLIYKLKNKEDVRK